MLRKRLTVFLAAAMMMMVMSAAPAFANHCANVSKKSGAGSIGTVNVNDPGEPTFDKQNGGFITVTDGATFSYDVFLHGTRPEGAMAAGPGGASECDGVGIDDAFACLGIDE